MKLSGQKAVFTVTLNYISESVLPELTDAWVADTFGTSNNLYTAEASAPTIRSSSTPRTSTPPSWTT